MYLLSIYRFRILWFRFLFGLVFTFNKFSAVYCIHSTTFTVFVIIILIFLLQLCQFIVNTSPSTRKIVLLIEISAWQISIIFQQMFGKLGIQYSIVFYCLAPCCFLWMQGKWKKRDSKWVKAEWKEGGQWVRLDIPDYNEHRKSKTIALFQLYQLYGFFLIRIREKFCFEYSKFSCSIVVCDWNFRNTLTSIFIIKYFKSMNLRTNFMIYLTQPVRLRLTIK